ncbi:hypothetical protein WP1_115 [Pseudomonas phage WP1]
MFNSLVNAVDRHLPGISEGSRFRAVQRQGRRAI